MNLADIRKKAGKETEPQPGATAGEAPLPEVARTDSVEDPVHAPGDQEVSMEILPAAEPEPAYERESVVPPSLAADDMGEPSLPDPFSFPAEPAEDEPEPEELLLLPHAEAPRAVAPMLRQEVELAPSFVAHNPLALLLAGREDDAAGVDEWDDGEEEGLGDAVVEYLCFRVSDELYAVNIMEIKEIIRPREATEVPRAPFFISGVLSLRGLIIPVFDMRKRLGLPPVQEGGKERIVVVKQAEGFCGILVDEVVQVVRIPVSTIEPAPAVLEGIDRDFVLGIGHYDEKMVILLSLEHILNLTLAAG
jgi:purine-binding chemotaxis protein CheW